MGEFIDIFFRSVFLENLALAYFLGMCTFLAVSKQIKTTLGLGAAVIVVEGIMTLAVPKIRELLDIRIFVDTDADIRLMRRILRDMRERGRDLPDIFRQYTLTVRPMHLEFVEPSKRYADVIVPFGGLNRVAMDMVVARLMVLLQDQNE